MDLERAFRFSSILLAAAGFSSLILTDALPIGLVLLGVAVVYVSLMQLAHRGERWQVLQWSKELWNVLIVLAFIAFIADFLWLSQDLLRAGIHFLVFLMVNKLLNLRQRRDFLHLYAVSLLQLLAAAALTVDISYGVAFVAYLLAAIWTLLLYNLRNEAEEVRMSPSPSGSAGPSALPMSGAITPRFFWATNAIAVGAFCLTLAIFFTIPRIGAGFFQKSRLELIRTSGFSERVDLSSIGAVKQDQTVVMRVEFPDGSRPAGELLYFRGAAYDFYDGRTWSNTLSRRRGVLAGPEGAFQVGERREGGQPTLRQEILLEPLDTPALFGVSAIDSIKSMLMVLQTDAMGNVYLPYSPWTRMHYSVLSTVHRLRAEERTGTELSYPPQITQRFLQTPKMSSRVHALAEAVTQRVQSPFEKVMALERYLKDNYHYTLDLSARTDPGAPPASPLEEFLFTRRSGYCEHYATAMVMLLRSIGIPARLLTGFLPGEWNDFGQYLTVRQRDAHAWVEVYFPKSGWVTFDPTPSDASSGSVPVLLQIGRVIDSIRLKWDRFVIQYSVRDQMAVAQGIRERGERLRAEVGTWTLMFREWAVSTGRYWKRVGDGLVLAVAGAATLAVMSVVIGILALTRILGARRRSPSFNSDATIVRLYERMLRLLKGRGFPKSNSSTPLEFARDIRRRWAAAGPCVDSVTELYCRVRFGRDPWTREDLREAEALLRGLKTSRASVRGQ